MGFLDKAKGMVSGNKGQEKQGIDKAADVVDDKAGAPPAVPPSGKSTLPGGP